MQIGIDSFAAAFDDGGLATSQSERLRNLVEQIERADQVGLAFRVQVLVFGEFAAARPARRSRGRVQVGNAQRLLLVLLVILSSHDLLYTRSDPLVEALNSR